MKLSQAEEIFHRALEFPTADERVKFLASACGSDTALREKVERLIAAQEGSPEFLPTQPGTITLQFPLSEKPGERIGCYKLLQQIGEGGMGVVYMAEQQEPVRRRVALKIIKVGMDTRQVIARFEAERQALALMDHPNIARVLDGGATESGRPYFVMELVQGLPITEFCDKNKLTPQQRLKLFLPVCHAIQSAHQKGIIHRDIKPSNVLVTLNHGEPVPKVIDFGIAKATNQRLTERTLFTNYATMIGTPAYMSPEQAEMTSLDIDTRTDVYSLGVLLYELMAGSPPFTEKRLRSAGYGEMQRIIAEEDPEKPSDRLSTLSAQEKTALTQTRGIDLAALGKAMKGELDCIIMKCLEKDRRRRYETPTELAADLNHHLNFEPISAGAPSLSYQLWKLYQRNRSFVIAAGIVALILVASTIVSVTMAVRAKRAEQARTTEAAYAKEQATIAQAVNQFLNEDLLGQADPKTSSNADIKVREVLERAAERIGDRFKGQPAVEAAIRRTIGTAYNSLGYYDKAETHLRRALDLSPQTQPTLADRVLLLIELSKVLSGELKVPQGEEVARTAYELGGHLTESSPSRIKAIANYGWVKAKRTEETSVSESGESVKLLREAHELARRYLGPDDPETIREVTQLCYGLSRLSRIGEVEQLASSTLTNLSADQIALNGRSVEDLRAQLAWIYLARGEFERSASTLGKISEASLSRDPESAQTASLRLTYAFSLHVQHKEPERQESILKETYQQCRQRFGPTASITLQAMMLLGKFYLDEKRYDDAKAPLNEAYVLTRPMDPTLTAREAAEILLASYETATGNASKADELLLPRLKEELQQDDNWLSSTGTFADRIKIAGGEEAAWIRCRSLLNQKPERQRLWNYYALFNIAFGSRPEFERSIKEMLVRFPPGKNTHESERILRLATLDEHISAERLRQLQPAAEQLKQDVDSRSVEGSSPWKNAGIALYLYRCGMFRDALERLNSERINTAIPSLTRLGGYSFAKTIAAMCQIQLGEPSAARILLEDAARYPEDSATKFHQMDARAIEPMALYYVVLRHEAERKLLP